MKSAFPLGFLTIDLSAFDIPVLISDFGLLVLLSQSGMSLWFVLLRCPALFPEALPGS